MNSYVDFVNGEESLLQPAGLEPEVDLKQALFNEPIVGIETTLLDENWPGALAPRAATDPRPMTQPSLLFTT